MTNLFTRQSTLVPNKFKSYCIGALTALMFSGISAAPAQAFTPELVEAKLHILECIGLLITDPDRHLEECGVGDGPGSPQSLNFHITGVITPPVMSYCKQYL